MEYAMAAFIQLIVSLMAMIANLILIRGIHRTKIFGNAYGTVLKLRSVMETICSLVTLGFFSHYTYFQYKIPNWFNVSITTIYIYCLASAYALHLIISLNRLFAVYMPLTYSCTFDHKTRVKAVIVGYSDCGQQRNQDLLQCEDFCDKLVFGKVKLSKVQLFYSFALLRTTKTRHMEQDV
ncbi:hypothetical protein L596_012163 [Steinernema carpocapsae]|uniref:7TM GPCR serpentine receptor class x (Srx) domain-containing protein n=1 Tax=Steinernema carpocapsae TaxID=34508 RepID=A0A4U5NWG4_STECR|nr:hypothetical protein L596_012163 [Steinernema carpocapsae]